MFDLIERMRFVFEKPDVFLWAFKTVITMFINFCFWAALKFDLEVVSFDSLNADFFSASSLVRLCAIKFVFDLNSSDLIFFVGSKSLVSKILLVIVNGIKNESEQKNCLRTKNWRRICSLIWFLKEIIIETSKNKLVELNKKNTFKKYVQVEDKRDIK